MSYDKLRLNPLLKIDEEGWFLYLFSVVFQVKWKVFIFQIRCFYMESFLLYVHQYW